MAKKKKDDKTLLYVGLGAAALLLLGKGGGSGSGALNSKWGYDIGDVQESETARDEGITEQFEPLEKRILDNARFYVRTVLDPISEALGGKVRINSWWRHPKTNDAIGGVSDSLHLDALAADLDDNPFSNREIVKQAMCLPVKYHKIIIYGPDYTNPQYLHISAKRSGNAEKILWRKPGGGYEELNKGRLKQIFGC